MNAPFNSAWPSLHGYVQRVPGKWFLRYGVRRYSGRTDSRTHSDGQARMQYASDTVFQRWQRPNKLHRDLVRLLKRPSARKWSGFYSYSPGAHTGPDTDWGFLQIKLHNCCGHIIQNTITSKAYHSKCKSTAVLSKIYTYVLTSAQVPGY